MWKPITIHDQVRMTAEKYPDKEVIVYKDRRVTFKQLEEEANLLAKGFLQKGMKKGDHIALWVTNWPEWIISWVAASKIGAVIIPINTRYKSSEVEYILKQSDSRMLILMDGFLGIDYIGMLKEMIPEIEGKSQEDDLNLEKFPYLKSIVSICDHRHDGITSFNTLLESGKKVSDQILRFHESQTSSSDTTIIVYTSGTTGFPKGAMHTHQILRNEYRIADWMEITGDDVILAHMPFYHVGAGFSVILPALIKGACMVCMEAFDSKEAMELIEKEKCTVLNGIPTHFIMMMQHPDFLQYDLKTIRSGWIGGSSIPEEVVKQIREKIGMPGLIAVYGMTETTSVTTFSRIGDPLEIVANWSGVPISHDYEVKIADPQNGEELARGQEGEVWVRGHIVMKGYYKNPDATKAAITEDGWFRTGDIGQMNEQGYLRITGRIKDMYIVGGTNTYPAEIEAHIFTHPKVKQAYIVGVPDARLGEVGMAFIELKDHAECTEEEIIEYCKKGLANYKVPRYVRFVHDFPMTASGKIQKYILQQQGIQYVHAAQER